MRERVVRVVLTWLMRRYLMGEIAGFGFRTGWFPQSRLLPLHHPLPQMITYPLRLVSFSSSVVMVLNRCALTISPAHLDSPKISCTGLWVMPLRNLPGSGCETTKGTILMCFALFLLKRLSPSFAKVREMDQADGLGLQEIFSRGCLRCKTGILRVWSWARIGSRDPRRSTGRRRRIRRDHIGDNGRTYTVILKPIWRS